MRLPSSNALQPSTPVRSDNNGRADGRENRIGLFVRLQSEISQKVALDTD